MIKQYPKNIKRKINHQVKTNHFKIIDSKTFFLLYGRFGIQSLESGKITFKQIEACRRTLRRGLKKKGKIWIRCFPRAQYFKKPIASRMGKGKGKFSHWFSPIKKGQILFEINIKLKSVRKIFRVLEKGCTKLPLQSKAISINY